jgi:bzd-type benzoyl-CoA reductase N subunit
MGDALKRLLDMREDPFAYARAWKERTGRPVIGFFCCYTAEEIIHAAGALPVRITGADRSMSKSGAHLQSYCCSLARTSLDMALEGELEFMDGTSFVHTCDTMQRLSDIWRLNTGYAFHFDTVLPVRFEGTAAEDYLYDELAAFRRKMEQAVGKDIDDAALKESIRAYNRNRELLAELYRMRRENPEILPSDQALWVTASSALMEKSEHSGLLEELLSDLAQESPPPSTGEARGEGGKVPLFGIGSVMDQWQFLKMVEDIGGTLVDDDFCTGHRYFDAPAPDDADPLKSIALRMTSRSLCPCKHRPSDERASCITERVSGSGAKGAIFFQFKYCEPHAFDYPYLKGALDEMGIPTLLLEIEQGSVSIEQLRTRVEALLESIRAE